MPIPKGSRTHSENVIFPGSALCLLEMDGVSGKFTVSLDDKTGVIRMSLMTGNESSLRGKNL